MSATGSSLPVARLGRRRQIPYRYEKAMRPKHAGKLRAVAQRDTPAAAKRYNVPMLILQPREAPISRALSGQTTPVGGRGRGHSHGLTDASAHVQRSPGHGVAAAAEPERQAVESAPSASRSCLRAPGPGSGGGVTVAPPILGLLRRLEGRGHQAPAPITRLGVSLDPEQDLPVRATHRRHRHRQHRWQRDLTLAVLVYEVWHQVEAARSRPGRVPAAPPSRARRRTNASRTFRTGYQAGPRRCRVGVACSRADSRRAAGPGRCRRIPRAS
jgi:hypothetical protein